MASLASNDGAGLGSGAGAIGGKEDGGRGRGREEDISNSSWFQKIETSIARSRKVRGGNFVQIATVDKDGFPSCRTVVFRGFLPLANGDVALKMITDARSSKVAHILNCPKCEMVYWFGKSSEQYRISGDLQLVSGTEDEDKELFIARKQQWGNLSDSAREQVNFSIVFSSFLACTCTLCMYSCAVLLARPGGLLRPPVCALRWPR